MKWERSKCNPIETGVRNGRRNYYEMEDFQYKHNSKAKLGLISFLYKFYLPVYDFSATHVLQGNEFCLLFFTVAVWMKSTPAPTLFSIQILNDLRFSILRLYVDLDKYNEFCSCAMCLSSINS